MRLSIDLDDRSNPLTLHPGRRLSGRLRIVAPETTRCEALTIALAWRTSGEGTEESGRPVELRLFQGEWAAGAEAEYPFELEVPPGPFTYEGRALQVRWVVAARAALPWAIDVTEERPSVLLPWTRAALAEQSAATYRDTGLVRRDGFSAGGSIDSPEEAADVDATKNAAMLGCGTVLVLVGAVGLVIALQGGGREWARLVMGGVVGVLLVVAGLVRRHTAARIGGEPKLSLGPEVLELGEVLRARVALRPRSTVQIERAYARIRCAEVARRGSGKSQHTTTVVLHEERRELAPPGHRLEPGRQVELSVELPLPGDRPPSFEAESNDVAWTLELVIKPRGALAWTREVPLAVRPPLLETLRRSRDD